MPVYEYECKGCGHTFEKLVFHPGEEHVDCPRCHGEVRRLMSQFTVDVPDEACSHLPRGEQRDYCTACHQGDVSCPFSA